MGTRKDAAQQKPVVNVQFKITSDSEDAEGYGSVLAQLQGVPKELRTDLKTFRLALDAFDGEIPEKFDGISVDLTIDPEADEETDGYMIPANFKVVGEIAEGAYLPKSAPVDLGVWLRNKGFKV